MYRIDQGLSSCISPVPSCCGCRNQDRTKRGKRRGEKAAMQPPRCPEIIPSKNRELNTTLRKTGIINTVGAVIENQETSRLYVVVPGF